MPRKTYSTHPGMTTRRSCFNEAAARCRGKHGRRRWQAMPIRGFNEAAARCRGKLASLAGGCDPTPCFNEAAARCRGKLERFHERPRSGPRFNEAAARCRGKPRPGGARVRARGASMRPRPDAAENYDVLGDIMQREIASMRPRPDAAENAAAAADKYAAGVAASMRPRPDAAENNRILPSGAQSLFGLLQ